MVKVAHRTPLKTHRLTTRWPRDEEPGTTSESDTTAVPVPPQTNHDDLAKRILHRIESRLPNRIRNLVVSAEDNAIVISGQCSTFYTKQIAQHTAMGALEYEKLINNIDVCS